jgi:hypothetical protein
MRRCVVVLVLGLMLLGTLAPGLEALTGCAQPCNGDDVNNSCTQEVCCSCCLHTGPAAPSRSAILSPLSHSNPPNTQAAGRALSAEPRGVLHVPKTGLL